MNLYSHSLPNTSPDYWEKLEIHLDEVASLAVQFAEKIGSSSWLHNAGWLHDLGKVAPEFQNYLLRENGFDPSETDDSVGGRINHSSAGAAFAEEKFNSGQRLYGRILSYIIAGHHAGLPDWHPSDSANAALLVRLSNEGKKNIDAVRHLIGFVDKELKPVNSLPCHITRKNLHFWIRMMFSCLVDADFLRTEAFMSPERSAERRSSVGLNELKDKFDGFMRQKTKYAPQTKVNQIRKTVLDSCRAAGSQKAGLFSLTVPTGGGKTLSSMAFALEHATVHQNNRIIYVIPYTSIIEQTAAILGEIFGSENVIEHHSNINSDKETQQSKLASENWDAPIIVTTNVQFFESLYAARPSRCRKLHNLQNSIVILDEAQLLPPDLLGPCVDALNELTENYQATVLFATATQPALPGISHVREIIQDSVSIYEELKRTEIVFPQDMNTCSSWDQIAGELRKKIQVLCIVNTRKDCRTLHGLMPKGTVHLSTLMCGEHRSFTIRKIKENLKTGQSIRVISTQLVEAGVDIDFPVVYRALAGLDSIAQAAGRCNREGKLNDQGSLGHVHVFVPPKSSPPGLLLKGENVTRELYSMGNIDALAPDSYERYFKLYYSSLNDTGQGILKDLIPDNDELAIPFRSIATKFRLIDDSAQRTVLVPYGNGKELIHELKITGPYHQLLRKLQRFTINLPVKLFDRFKAAGRISEVNEGFFIWEGWYDEVTGADIYEEGPSDEDCIV